MKVLRLRRNLCHCVRLVLLIPAVYLLRQTESVWRRYRVLSEKSNREKFDADWAGHVARPYSDTWQIPYSDVADSHTWHVARGGFRTGHVASPGCDTCHADLALLACGRTNIEVTRVTTHRVTRGTLTSAW
jgi:hypothetical protein